MCRKQAGLDAPPPGGYLYQDEHWRVCHAPADSAYLGTLIVESRRHFLDFAEMNEDETTSYGALLRRLYRAVRSTTTVERLYQILLLEGTAHFHVWLVPRLPGNPVRGLELLAQPARCETLEAEQLSVRLRAYLVENS